jgi:ribosomal RNA-processing protein 1
MSDKPVIQLELATRLSKMTHIFKTPELQLLFVRTFWNTMTREWTHLDKFRYTVFVGCLMINRL